MSKFYYVTLSMLVDVDRGIYGYVNYVIAKHPFRLLSELQEYQGNIPKWVLINWKEISDEEYAIAWETGLIKQKR